MAGQNGALLLLGGGGDGAAPGPCEQTPPRAARSGTGATGPSARRSRPGPTAALGPVSARGPSPAPAAPARGSRYTAGRCQRPGARPGTSLPAGRPAPPRPDRTDGRGGPGARCGGTLLSPPLTCAGLLRAAPRRRLLPQHRVCQEPREGR